MQEHITPAGRSVLDDLHLDPTYVVKAKLALRIQMTIAELGLSHSDAAKRLAVPSARLSLLARGDLDQIDQVELELLLQVLGHDIDVVIGPRRDRVGQIIVREATRGTGSLRLSRIRLARVNKVGRSRLRRPSGPSRAVAR